MKAADSLIKSGKMQSIGTTLVPQTEHLSRQRQWADSPKTLLPQ